MSLALRANALNDSTWVDDIGGSTDVRPQLVLLRSITEPPSAPRAERDDEPHIVVHELAPSSAAALALLELELAGRDEPAYGELPPSTYAPPPRHLPLPAMHVGDAPRSVWGPIRRKNI